MEVLHWIETERKRKTLWILEQGTQGYGRRWIICGWMVLVWGIHVHALAEHDP
jgi:hypothetical protein